MVGLSPRLPRRKRLRCLLFQLCLPLLIVSSLLVQHSYAEPFSDREAAEHNEAGVKLFEQGRFGQAVEKFEQALRLRPSSKEIRTNLGKALAAVAVGLMEEAHASPGADAKAHQAALEHLNQALLHWAGDADTYHAKAICLLHLDRVKQAAVCLEQAVSIDARAVRCWRLLGVARERAGNLEPALSALRKAQKIEPDTGIAQRIRRLQYDVEAVKTYRRLTSERFRLLCAPQLDDPACQAIRQTLETLARELEKRWSLATPREVTVICYPPGEFGKRTGLHDEVGGAFDGRIRIAFPTELAAGGLEVRQVIRHEVVHSYLHQLPHTPPRWLDEGIAQVIDGQSREMHREAFMELLRREPHVGILGRQRRFRDEDTKTWPALYLHSYFLMKHVVSTRGQFRLDMLIRDVGNGRTWEDAWQRVFGQSVSDLDQEWRRKLLALPK